MTIKFVINKERRCRLSCAECRRKKQKCDSQKPECGRCLAIGLECKYSKASNRKKTTTNSNLTVVRTSCIDSLLFSKTSDEAIVATNSINDCFVEQELVPEYDDKHTESRCQNPYKNDTGVFQNFNNSRKTTEYTIDTTLSTYSLNLDLEFQALSIISSSESLKNYFAKYNQCYSLLRALSYKNKAVMFSFTGWLLEINQNSLADKFLTESAKYFDSIELKLLSNNNFNEELTGVIVSQTCHALITSSRGDYLSWRKIFDQIYKLLNLLGIDEAISLFQNNPFILWVFGWFFYQDMFRMGKISKQEFFRPLFPKHTYMKMINTISQNKFDKSTLVSGFGPLTKCCMNLLIMTGETNTLYDLFRIKRESIDKYYSDFISPILQSESVANDELFTFLESPIYQKYDIAKKEFYSGFIVKVNTLELRISEAKPNMELSGLTDEQKSKFELYYDVLKKSLTLFIKIKLLACSIHSLEIKTLCWDITEGLHTLVEWELNNYLLFPLLIVGTCVCDKTDKIMVERVYTNLKKYLRSGNLEKIWETIQRFWTSYSASENDQTLSDLICKMDCNVCVF